MDIDTQEFRVGSIITYRHLYDNILRIVIAVNPATFTIFYPESGNRLSLQHDYVKSEFRVLIR